jgi:hypothetical protein
VSSSKPIKHDDDNAEFGKILDEYRHFGLIYPDLPRPLRKTDTKYGSKTGELR